MLCNYKVSLRSPEHHRARLSLQYNRRLPRVGKWQEGYSTEAAAYLAISTGLKGASGHLCPGHIHLCLSYPKLLISQDI